MPFVATPTLAELRASLAQRLADSSNVHWTAAELNQLINEALRTWNCAAVYFRARGTFATTASQPFYDLRSLLRDGSNSLILGQTVASQQVCSALEFSLMEPQTADYNVAWTGTEQFSFEAITDAIQNCRDRFLSLGITQVEELDLVNVPAGSGLVNIGERSTSDIRRVAWKSLEGRFSNLWRTDEQTLGRRLPDWSSSSGIPVAYSLVSSPETLIQLAPPPVDNGQLHILVIADGREVSLPQNSLIDIPNDFVPYLQWWVRAELLGRDGPAYDTVRAQYAAQRQKEGLQLAELFTTVLDVRVNDVPVPIESLERFDLRLPDWQHTTGTPAACAVAAPNLIALYPVPDGTYSVSVDVVRNAPQLSADADRVQMPEIKPLLDYCQHIAMFKDGGADFLATIPYYKSFMEAAAEYNNALKAHARNFDILARRSQKEREERPAEVAA